MKRAADKELSLHKFYAFLFFSAMILLLLLSPIGLYQGQVVALTTLHIPVILGAIYLGETYGACLGIIWGLCVMHESLTKTYGEIDQLFSDPVVAILPKIATALVTALVFRCMSCFLVGKNTRLGCIMSTATAVVIGTWSNAFFVLLAMVLKYSRVLKVTEGPQALSYMISYIGKSNTVFEMLLALATSIPLMIWMTTKREKNQSERVGLSFRRYLLLMVSVCLVFFLSFIYSIQTRNTLRSYQLFLQGEFRYLQEQISHHLTEGQVLSPAEKDKKALEMIEHYQIGSSGYVLLCKNNVMLNDDGENNKGKTITDTLYAEAAETPSDEMLTFHIDNTQGQWLCAAYRIDEYLLITVSSYQTVFEKRNTLLFWSTVGTCVLILSVLILISRLLQQLIIAKIQETNTALSTISKGDLGIRLTIGGNQEFDALTGGINSMVDAIQHLMAESALQLERELYYASEIQHSVLPDVKNMNEEVAELTLAADMQTAKEVGGDFYDFFLIGRDRIGIVIADVSGKGIPAALYMMTAKALLRTYMETGEALNRVIEKVNDSLCRNSSAKRFVTVFAGILDIGSGEFSYVNAGHCKPLLLRQEEKSKWLQEKPNLFLGGIAGIPYELRTMQLQDKDMLLFYTDGITEAENKQHEFYGAERLKALMDDIDSNTPQQLIEAIETGQAAFREDTEQTDDITIVALQYQQKELVVPALLSALPEIMDWVETLLIENGNTGDHRGLLLAVEEIFVNIASYAYDADEKPDGVVTLRAAKQAREQADSSSKQEWKFTFIDEGKPFNPLTQDEQELSTTVEEQKIGGWGIALARKQADKMEYRYEHGKNILVLEKTLS